MKWLDDQISDGNSTLNKAARVTIGLLLLTMAILVAIKFVEGIL